MAGKDANTKVLNSRFDKLPRYSGQPVEMGAPRDNQAQRGLLRLRGPQRFHLRALRHRDVFLEHDAWICVDASLNDTPVFAWTNFEIERRNVLYEPLRCMSFTCHAHAPIIINRVLQAIADYLDSRLQEHGANR